MSRFDGSLARALDFEELPAHGGSTANVPNGLRLAQPGALLRGPNKYEVLAHRRRQAQIQARRLLELMDGR